MDRTPLSSTNIIAVGFEPDQDNPESGTLEIEFKRDVVYQYTDVPKHVYQGLLWASSAGKYFKANIAEQFDGQRIA